METIHKPGLCPWFDYLPSKKHVGILDDERIFEMMLDLGKCYAEDASIVSLSGRLLIVARRHAPQP